MDIKNSVLAVLLAAVGMHSSFSSDVLLKHHPIYKFKTSTIADYVDCELTKLEYWTERRYSPAGAGVAQKHNEISKCVTRYKTTSREPFLSALKYLDGKPVPQQALKEYYLKWLSSIESLIPDSQETERTHDERIRKGKDAMNTAVNALELELELVR